MNIFITEDDPIIRCALAFIFRKKGHEVVEAVNVHNARQLLTEMKRASAIERIAYGYPLGDIEVVISDYHLGDGLGSEVLSLTQELFPNAKRILLSGEPQETLDEVSTAQVRLRKPATFDELMQAIEARQ